MATQKQPPGEPMTLGNMRALGVQRLLASCLNDACRHTPLIDVWSYPAETEIPYFSTRVVCANAERVVGASMFDPIGKSSPRAKA